MPIGPYKDMAACMAANKDKADPAAFCAAMEQRMHKIAKTDPDRQLVFGWANVAVRKNGSTVVDHDNEQIAPQDLEDAAYLYNLQFREANEMHGPAVKGRLVESLVVTKEKLTAMGLASDALPQGWWVGFHVDADTFAKVKAGVLNMFSIEGTAEPVPA